MNTCFHSDSEARTIEAGAGLAALLRGGDVVLLEGELGAGKTCMARGIGQALGLEARAISSPTFTILHQHDVALPGTGEPDGVGGRLYHLDAYRLGGVEELESIGWEEILADKSGIIVLEWGSRIIDAVPANALRIELKHAGETIRELQLHVPDSMAARFEGCWSDDQAGGVSGGASGGASGEMA